MLQELKKERAELFTALMEDPRFERWYRLGAAIEFYIEPAPKPAALKTQPSKAFREAANETIRFDTDNPDHVLAVLDTFRRTVEQARSVKAASFTSFQFGTNFRTWFPQFDPGSNVPFSRISARLFQELGVKKQPREGEVRSKVFHLIYPKESENV